MGNGIATIGGIVLVILGFVQQNAMIILSGSILVSAALIADAILDSREAAEK